MWTAAAARAIKLRELGGTGLRVSPSASAPPLSATSSATTPPHRRRPRPPPRRQLLRHLPVLIHPPPPPPPSALDQIVNETIPALQKIKESGKARFIGITGLPLSIYTYVLDRVPPGSIDVILSYCHFGINDTSLVDLLPYLKSKGVGVISASPLAMGLLTDNGPPEWHPAPKELKLACRAAAEHCRKKGKSITKLAMQYSLMNKEISTVLVRMNSSEQVEENVAAAIELSTSGIDKELLHEVYVHAKARKSILFWFDLQSRIKWTKGEI